MTNILMKKGSNVVNTPGSYSPALEDGAILFDLATGKIYLDSATERKELYADLGDAIKDAKYEDNKIKLYTVKNPAAGTTAAVELDLPAEQFLDVNKSTFVESFAFSTTLYPGATDPNLDGKPVLVLALKDTKGTNEAFDDTYAYSFCNMEKLVDSNKADKIDIAVTGADDEAKAASAAAQENEIVVTHIEGNATDGYKANIKKSGKKIVSTIPAAGSTTGDVPNDTAVRAELELKADKVSGGTEDNLVSLDANGNIQDSGISVSDTIREVANAVDTVVVSEKAIRTALDTKSDKPASATEDNIATFDDKKNAKDSGKKFTTSIGATADAADTNVPTEKAVRAELDKKANKLTLTAEEIANSVTLADHANELVAYDNAGDIKSSGKKIRTLTDGGVRPATGPDVADDDTLATEAAVRAAVNNAALVWGTF